MRTSLYLIGFAAASIMGAGAVGFGCSSSSSPAPNNPTPEASTGEEASTEAGGEEAGEPEAEPAEAAACVPAPVNVATYDAGAAWACTQTACADGGLAACGADCTCNAAIFSALLCVNDGGPSTTVTCFTNAITPVISDPAVLPFATCLQTPAVTKCTGGAGTDGGTEGGTDGGTDGGTITDGSADGGG